MGMWCPVYAPAPYTLHRRGVFYHKQTVTCVSANDARFAASGSDDCSVKVFSTRERVLY